MKKYVLPIAFAFLLGYFVSDLVDAPIIEDAQADSRTIERILFCLDGSSIEGSVSGGYASLNLSTYCNR